MGKNTREGNRERAARRRAALAARGIKQILLMAPEQAHPLLKQAAGLMTREQEPVEPRAALRRVGGANEPGPEDAVSPALAAELQAARARIEAIEREAAERQAEAERQRQALEARLDAAKASEVAAQEEARWLAAERRAAARRTREALEQAREALERAETAKEKAESTIRRAKSLPGLRGRLVRWMAGDVLK